jgi:hypothetical protein
MSMFVETIEEKHEFRHVPNSDPTFNESTYYNFACPGGGPVGWLRVAMQPNQPASQAGVMIFLPDRALFTYQRSSTSPSDGLTAGNLTFEIEVPHQRQHLHFQGTLAEFLDPRALLDPSKAFREAPRRAVKIDLHVRAHGPAFGTNGEDAGNYVEQTMALGHFEQFIRVEGSLTVDGEEVLVDGSGLRDHSWGPRDWAAPSRYRWAVANLDDGTQFMALLLTRRNGDVTRAAAVVRDGRLSEAQLLGLTVDWTPDGFGEQVVIRLASADGPLTLTARGRQPLRFFPLRHRRQGEVGDLLDTRIGYSAYDFSTDDGRTGTGMVEILDQLVDGLPQSIRETDHARDR